MFNLLKKLYYRIIMCCKKYYCIKQQGENDCGAACLATVARQYGKSISLSRIRKIAGTDRKGTTAWGLVEAARKVGFNASGVKAGPDDIRREMVPFIAHCVKNNRFHYVVVQDIVEDRIVVADPAAGIIDYKGQEFFRQWTGVLILLSPAPGKSSGVPVDDNGGMVRQILSQVLSQKKLIIEIFLASLLYTVLGIAGAFYFKYLIDTVLVDGLKRTLHVLSMGMILLIIFKIILNAFRKHLLLYLAQRIDLTLILNYYQHILKLPLAFFASRKTGEILSRLRDATKIRSVISGATITVLIDSLMVIIGGIVLYIQSNRLFGITAVILPLYVLIVWFFNTRYSRVHRREMESAAGMQSYLVETVSGIETLKSFNLEQRARMETESRFVKYITAIFRATWLRNIQFSLQTLLTALCEVIILWTGGFLVIEGQLSIGQLITYNALLAYFYDPLQNLITLQPELQEAAVAAGRLAEIMNLEPEERGTGKIKPDKFNGLIEINNLCFRYGKRERILKDLNLTIDPGDKVALTGKSGSGKTTLVKLLFKYYLPETGEILIDGHNILDISRRKLRAKIGYIPQETFLFSGSIRENITLNKPDVSREKVITAAKMANLHRFINDLPARYETPVGERGINLSGGQKQKIAIARALIKKPDILVLDEATGNLDLKAEENIHRTISKICRGTTTIIIAHRLQRIKWCDKIFVLDKGRIAEAGNHEELLDRRGIYADLWQGGFNEER